MKNGIASIGKESIPVNAFCAIRTSGRWLHEKIVTAVAIPREIPIGTESARRTKSVPNRKHLRIDILSSKLKGKSRITLEILVLSLWCAFSAFLGWQGIKLVSVVVKTGQLSTAMQISMGWAYLCIPLAGIFMTIRLVFEILGILRTGEIIKPELTEEEAMIEEAKKGVSM